MFAQVAVEVNVGTEDMNVSYRYKDGRRLLLEVVALT
jgi:hypothetical protein